MTTQPSASLPVYIPTWAYYVIGFGSALVVGGIVWLIVAFCYSMTALKSSARTVAVKGKKTNDNSLVLQQVIELLQSQDSENQFTLSPNVLQ